MASFGRFTSGAGGSVETLSYAVPTLTLTQSAGTSPLTANIPAGVGGSGTSAKIPVWSNSNTLADSLINDNGANIYTQYLSNYLGIDLDFVNNIFWIGSADNCYLVDTTNNLIYTKLGGGNIGLYLDSANNYYFLGDHDGIINGTNIKIFDSSKIIALNTERTQFLGVNNDTIANFDAPAEGQLVYNNEEQYFQYFNSVAWTQLAPKTTYMMTGVFTNMFGGDPGGTGKDILEWGASSPAGTHSSVLPILQDCSITSAGFKWISSTAVPLINPADSWTIKVYKMNNPASDSTTIDANFTFVGNLNITLDYTYTGTWPGVFSSGELAIPLLAGDIIRIAGVETGTIGTTTEEAQLTILFEVA